MVRVYSCVLAAALLAVGPAAPASAITLATIGDSYTDYYYDQGYTHANWTEHLAWNNTGVDFGPNYSYNFATAGYWTGNALSGQTNAVVNNLHNIDYVVIDIGINDFLTVAAGPTPGYPIPERYIRIGKGETALANSVSNTAFNNIAAMIDRIRDADPDKKIILANIGDWGSTKAFRTAAIDKMVGLDFRQTGGNKNKQLRARFTTAINSLNSRLATLAHDLGIPVINKAKLLKKAETDTALAFAGNKKINTKYNPGANMQEGGAYAFWADGLHPGTAWHGIYANVVTGILKNYYGESVTQLTARQIMSDYYGGPVSLPGANDKIAALWNWQDYALLPPAQLRAKLLATSAELGLDPAALEHALAADLAAHEAFFAGSPSAVPEPAAAALLLTAAPLLLTRRRAA